MKKGFSDTPLLTSRKTVGVYRNDANNAPYFSSSPSATTETNGSATIRCLNKFLQDVTDLNGTGSLLQLTRNNEFEVKLCSGNSWTTAYPADWCFYVLQLLFVIDFHRGMHNFEVLLLLFLS